mgnify:CR=1 FL=1
MVVKPSKLMIMLILTFCVNVPVLISEGPFLAKVFSVMTLGIAILVTIIRIIQAGRIRKLRT